MQDGLDHILDGDVLVISMLAGFKVTLHEKVRGKVEQRDAFQGMKY